MSAKTPIARRSNNGKEPNPAMEYKMKVKELDEATDYPVDVLAGMTGLGFDTIRKLEQEGRFSFKSNAEGQQVVNGGDFLGWAKSVNHTIEVEKTDYKH
jgi:hypothetical protein